MSPSVSLPVRTELPDIELVKKLPKNADALLVPIFSENEGVEFPVCPAIDKKTTKELLSQFKAVGAKAKAGEITRIPGVELPIIAVGLGAADEVDDEKIRRTVGTAARSLKDLEHVVVAFGALSTRALVEGLLLGSYSYPGFRGAKADDQPTRVSSYSVIADPKTAKEEFVAAHITAESVCLARDLVNTPSSHLYPETYAAFLQSEAKKCGVDVDVLDEKALEKKGFGGILAVGQGSARPPRLVHLRWSPRHAKKKVAMVGKGITFDTGGISIKPSLHMENMISDMGGSAAVVATVFGAARLNLNVEINAFVALAENMPDGNAIRPGDVITHYGGITSEILNTDAEGRLVLADALARASEDHPDYLIETATLTGAQIVALGVRTSGVMGSDEFRDRLAETGRKVGEPAWAMPLLEEHEKTIKTPAADIRNVDNTRHGGMLYAGTYLSKFIGDGIEWAHVDIAGPSFNEGRPDGYLPVRATGVPVRTFLAVLADIAEQN
ncbi:leucyl aminopeptidase [Corynebacterium poyangense]|uniref:Probable cytosol aminopeptidase n=1 Tax=Corynebacterium poyangense TaxID=2684405 RepID=A0A7H0SPW5_9CORY|nr:leucyl aminopeptidase [Corynebacterium poyangense]MBZ8178183.1 leucyl aminopeptidase [Corynebacterium poyangense]QNQ90590.1 leucyl aminopeptidase [Corynebacterium poyangense]